MGSGFSTCNGRGTVVVQDTHWLHRSASDSAISVNTGLSSSSDSGIAKSDQFKPESSEVDVKEVQKHFFENNQSPRPISCRPGQRRIQIDEGCRLKLKPNRRSAPNLTHLVISEEDENEDETLAILRTRQRKFRPKTAHVRKRRNLKSAKSQTGTFEKTRKTEGDTIALNETSDAEITNDDFDSDVISIPDETSSPAVKYGGIVKLGPQFAVSNEYRDWWKETLPREQDDSGLGIYSSRNNREFSGQSRDVNIVKKASERSISSIILAPIELGTPTNSEWFELTNNVTACQTKKKVESLEDDLWQKISQVSAKENSCKTDYEKLIKGSHDQCLQVLAYYRNTVSDDNCTLNLSDTTLLENLETQFVENLMLREGELTRTELSFLLTDHLQGIEKECISGKDEYSDIKVGNPFALFKVDSRVNEVATQTGVRQGAQSVGLRRSVDFPDDSEGFNSSDKSTPVAPGLVDSHCSCPEKLSNLNTLVGEALDVIETRWTSITSEELLKLLNVCRLQKSSVAEGNGFIGLRSALSYSEMETLVDTENDSESDVEFVKWLIEGQRVGTLTCNDAKSVFKKHLLQRFQTHEREGKKPDGTYEVRRQDSTSQITNEGDESVTSGRSIRSSQPSSRPCTEKSLPSTSLIHTKLDEMDSKSVSTKSRPDSGVVVSSSSASYSSSEAARDMDVSNDNSWIAASLEMLENIFQVRTEDHQTLKSLITAITRDCDSSQLKAHAIYRWLASQSLAYYARTSKKASSPTGKLKQLAEGKTSYANVYMDMARVAGLKCEKIDGFVKNKDYRPGSPVKTALCQHSWNAVSLDGQYRLLDAQFGSRAEKFFVEHYFMTPPDEIRLSHFPKDRKWLMMNQLISLNDFESTLKTWPAMFAFNIRPLNMKSVIRTYDGKLSITVLLQNVAVNPQLDYEGPGPMLDSENLAYNIDQEIRSTDNAETFHVTLPQEGVYYFTLMVHDLEEGEDIPVFQYKLEYKDELL